MHLGKCCWYLRSEFQMRIPHFCLQLIEEICSPVPLQAGGQQTIEHLLNSGVRHWPKMIKQRFHSQDGLKYFICFFQIPGIAPYHSAKLFFVKMFRKWRPGDYHRCKKTI